MGTSFSLCGTCNAETTFRSNEENQSKLNNEKILIRINYIEQILNETKDELKDTKRELREDMKEIKSDLIMLINSVNNKSN